MKNFDFASLSPEDRKAYDAEIAKIHRLFSKKVKEQKVKKAQEQLSLEESLNIMRESPEYKDLRTKYKAFRENNVKGCCVLDANDPILRNFVVSYEMAYNGSDYGCEADNIEVSLNKEVYGKKKIAEDTLIGYLISTLQEVFDDNSFNHFYFIPEVRICMEVILKEADSFFKQYVALCKKHKIDLDLDGGICPEDMEIEFE